MDMFFLGGKAVADVRISEFLKFGPFYDVTGIKNYPKLPKFPLKHIKTRGNDCLELKFDMDMVFVAAKPLLMSEFQMF